MKIKHVKYPYKIKKMLLFYGMKKGFFIRLAIKGIYTRQYPHLDSELEQKLEDSGFKIITLDETWFNRFKKSSKSIIVRGVWCNTEEELNLFRLMFDITKNQIYEF